MTVGIEAASAFRNEPALNGLVKILEVLAAAAAALETAAVIPDEIVDFVVPLVVELLALEAGLKPLENGIDPVDVPKLFAEALS
jgi:hypothetical protein